MTTDQSGQSNQSSVSHRRRWDEIYPLDDRSGINDRNVRQRIDREDGKHQEREDGKHQENKHQDREDGKNQEPDICTICQDGYLIDRESFELPCGHKFHIGCIITSLRHSSNRCPICRDTDGAQDVHVRVFDIYENQPARQQNNLISNQPSRQQNNLITNQPSRQHNLISNQTINPSSMYTTHFTPRTGVSQDSPSVSNTPINSIQTVVRNRRLHEVADQDPNIRRIKNMANEKWRESDRLYKRYNYFTRKLNNSVLNHKRWNFWCQQTSSRSTARRLESIWKDMATRHV